MERSVRDDGLPPDQYRPPRLDHLCLFNGDFLKSKLIRPLYLQVVLALFGRSLGVRRLYVRVLLAIFQVHFVISHLSFVSFEHEENCSLDFVGHLTCL